MVAAIAAPFDPYSLAGRGCELAEHRCGDRLLSRAFQCGLGAQGVGLGLIADRLQPGDSLLKAGVVEIGDTGLDGVVEPLETEVSFRSALIQLGYMLAPPLGALMATVQYRGENLLQPLGSQQAVLD